MSRQWTPWTAALAWGELLTLWHIDHDEDTWASQPDGTDRKVTVLIGRCVRVLAAQAGGPPASHPDSLETLSLAALAAMLGDAAELERACAAEFGPSSADELGHDDDREIAALLQQHGPDWATLTSLCAQVGTALARAEGAGLAKATLRRQRREAEKKARKAYEAQMDEAIASVSTWIGT